MTSYKAYLGDLVSRVDLQHLQPEAACPHGIMPNATAKIIWGLCCCSRIGDLRRSQLADLSRHSASDHRLRSMSRCFLVSLIGARSSCIFT